ncbi:MAG: metalloregulator ArsR/SmtB family transcription factor [Gammaproteobacteria bacterium]|nr:metalloregulator ArsR/SmtB family transcription factor [Gammaproteobacteria bacterium]
MTYTYTFEALSDETRRLILARIAKSPCTVGEIVQLMPVSQPAVSQHLKILKEAGLVTAKKDGVKRIYSIAPDGIAGARNYLDQLWGDALEAFKEAAKAKAKENPDEAR